MILSVAIILITLTVFLTSNNIHISVTKNKSISLRLIGVFLSLFILTILSTLRGDFTTDYNNYVYIFNRYNDISFEQFWYYIFNSTSLDTIELGFAAINYIIGLLTDNPIWVFFVSSLLILLPLAYIIKKYTRNPWFAFVLFFIIGGYFASFNIMRHMIAVSFFVLSIVLLSEKKYTKALLTLSIASLFHISVLIVCPLLLIIFFKPTTKTFILYFFVGLILLVFLNPIVQMINALFYDGIYIESSTGFGFQTRIFTNAVIPVSIGIFTLFTYFTLNNSKVINKVIINGTLLWVLFEILSLRLFFITRISSYFSFFAVLYIAKVIADIKDIRLKILLYIVVLSFLYAFFFYFSGWIDTYEFI